jgi:hypothetical protein
MRVPDADARTRECASEKGGRRLKRIFATVGGALQRGRRTNFSDGFSSDGLKLQFSFKYNFSSTFGG